MAILRIRLLTIVLTILGMVAILSIIPDVSQRMTYAYENDGRLYQSVTDQSGLYGGTDKSSMVYPVSTYPREEHVLGTPLPGESLPTPRETQPEKKPFAWKNLSPSNTAKNVKTMIYGGPNEGVARALLAEGEQLFVEKSYDKAGERFQNAAERWPDSTLEEDAMFMQAESQFFTDHYPAAYKSYAKLLKKYGYTKHLDTSVRRLFMIGRYWEQLQKSDPQPLLSFNVTDSTRPWTDTTGHALKCYDAVRMYDPTGPLSDDAVMATATIYFRQKRFEESAYNYGLLRKEYPESSHVIKAHLLELESRQKMYQGAGYDGKPLDDAAEVSDILLTQFQSQLGDQRQTIVEIKNRIVQQQANRDWEIAQYYERKKFFGAARFYYQAIIKDYPHTQVAEASRKRFEEIRNYPSEPPKRLKWLTDLISPEK